MALSRLSLALAAAALACTAPVAGAQTSSFNDQQKAAIRDIVREYLISNPEVLQEAFQALEQRQDAAQKARIAQTLAEFRQSLKSNPEEFIVGNPQGNVTLIEFFDYNCGYCKRALGDVRQLVKADPNLQVVLMDFPVLGPDSVEASRVALAVRQQLKTPDKLFEYHTKLMDSRGRVGAERAKAVAKEMGLDVAKIERALDAQEVKDAIRANVELGDKLGLTGTPAFIIGDDIIPGAVGVDPLRKAVTNVRQCGKASC